MGELYHLKVGCGDASIITTGGRTFLIDCHNIGDHKQYLPKEKRLRGVFITHQHSDHFSGLEYLRDNGYAIDFLIYSPYDRRRGDNSVELDEWKAFEDHREYFRGKGTEMRAPCRQDSFDEAWWKVDENLAFSILGPHKSVAESDTRELHDACLVVKAHIGKRSCLFTGDASDTVLAKVADTTKHFCGDILHASHHGSANGADETFVSGCSAQYTVISTEDGVYESVPHPDALAMYEKHTKHKVYRTDESGTLTWSF